ncbi:MAG: protoporphyrinogen oxidase [Leptospirillia bacterium]
MATEDLETLVIGGGIAGLACATHLKRAGRTVRLVEQNDYLGGVIRTLSDRGYQIETGPNSLLVRSEEPLLRYLSLPEITEKIQLAGTTGKKRFILKNGRPVALPMSLLEGVFSPILSLPAKMRLLKEPFIPPTSPEDGLDPEKETVAEFVQRRLGKEFLESLIDPFVKGVYASDPHLLSMVDTFPRLVDMEKSYGSLIKGGLALSRQKKPPAPPFAREILSFSDGMGSLPEFLANILDEDAGTNAEVIGCARSESGFRTALLFEEETYYIRSKYLVLALPASQTAELIEPLAGGIPPLLEQIPYAPIAVVYLGYPRDKISHPLDGFGLLVPSRERRKILGALFSSSLFPGRAPNGQVLLTVFVGGMIQPKLAQAFDEDLLPMVTKEIESMLGVEGSPSYVRIQRWGGAIPQSIPGHGARIRAIEAALPSGLYLAGSYLSGVSVSQTFSSGIRAAEKILAQTP